MESRIEFCKTLKRELPEEKAIPLVDLHPMKMKSEF
jgi:hypothetical protein